MRRRWGFLISPLRERRPAQQNLPKAADHNIVSHQSLGVSVKYYVKSLSYDGSCNRYCTTTPTPKKKTHHNMSNHLWCHPEFPV